MMIITFVLLLAGILFLLKGADWFVGGAAALAKYLRIPSIVIGLTVVALGTSLPELAVSMTAALRGSNAIALGNALGSNIVNLLVVVGVSAMICPMVVQADVMKRDYAVAILFAALALLLALDILWGREGRLSRLDGLLMLAVLFVYLTITVRNALRSRPKADDLAMTHGIGWNIALILCGAAAIIAGGQMVVRAATDIARYFGLSETLIGLTVVAVGTSLPELVTSVVAAKKGESDLALGNVVGSNIMNIGFILGMSSFISPIAVGMDNLCDGAFLLIVSLIFFVPLYLQKKVTRGTAAAMLLVYAGYTAYIIMR